jgi:small nuclear ribonucleoprotein (snRNP)-like protein
MAIRPFDLIHRSLRKEIEVSMKNGSTFSGIIESYDENLNLFLTNVKEKGEGGRDFKTLVLKGGNIVSISPVK